MAATTRHGDVAAAGPAGTVGCSTSATSAPSEQAEEGEHVSSAARRAGVGGRADARRGRCRPGTVTVVGAARPEAEAEELGPPAEALGDLAVVEASLVGADRRRPGTAAQRPEVHDDRLARGPDRRGRHQPAAVDGHRLGAGRPQRVDDQLQVGVVDPVGARVLRRRRARGPTSRERAPRAPGPAGRSVPACRGQRRRRARPAPVAAARPAGPLLLGRDVGAQVAHGLVEVVDLRPAVARSARPARPCGAPPSARSA